MVRTAIATAGTALLLGLAGAASAATVSFSATPDVAVASPTAHSVTGLYEANTTGSTPGVKRSPWQGAALGETGAYSYVTGSATFSFGSDRSQLNFVWGSPDPYNSIDFYLDGGLVDTLHGFGDGTNLDHALATITGIGDEGMFDQVVFKSDSPAFEFANVAAVPLPAGGLLLLTALGAAGVLRRRAA